MLLSVSDIFRGTVRQSANLYRFPENEHVAFVGFCLDIMLKKLHSIDMQMTRKQITTTTNLCWWIQTWPKEVQVLFLFLLQLDPEQTACRLVAQRKPGRDKNYSCDVKNISMFLSWQGNKGQINNKTRSACSFWTPWGGLEAGESWPCSQAPSPL